MKFFFLLVLLTILIQIQSGATPREIIDNSLYRIEVIEDDAIITRKSDQKKIKVENLLWGEAPFLKIFPSKAISPNKQKLILPMADYSYLLIDLKTFFNDENNQLRIEGAVMRDRIAFSRSPLYCKLVGFVSDKIIKGVATYGRDVSFVFFIDTENKVVFSDHDDIKNVMFLREVSMDRESETPYSLMFDKEKIKALKTNER